MAFKDRISGMFGFGGKTRPKNQDAVEGPSQPASEDDDPGIPATTEPATIEEREQEREALLRELSHGFVHVGSTIERLDENLAAGTRSLEAMTVSQERLPALLAEQQHLIHEVAETASASRRALEALSEHLQQRDQAQQAIVDRLEAIGQGMAQQRDAHRQQLDLVMGFHRSSRLFMALLVFGGFLLVLLLVGALLFILLRPQLLAATGASADQASTTPAAAATAQPASPVTSQAGIPAATVPAEAAPVAAPAEAAPAKTEPAAPAPDPDPARTASIREAAASTDPTIARRARSALAATDAR